MVECLPHKPKALAGFLSHLAGAGEGLGQGGNDKKTKQNKNRNPRNPKNQNPPNHPEVTKIQACASVDFL